MQEPMLLSRKRFLASNNMSEYKDPKKQEESEDNGDC